MLSHNRTNNIFKIMLAGAAVKVAVVALVAAFVGFTPSVAGAETALTKQDVEKIVEEYIMNNAETIMRSVDEYQRRTVQERQAATLDSSRKELFETDGLPVIGNPKADVTIVAFYDYNCGFCKRATPEVEAVLEQDKNVRVIFRELPILGPTSETAAKWSLAAHKHNKFIAFHRAMMNNKGPVNEASLTAAAKEAGLDPAVIKKDAESSDILVKLERDRSLAQRLGISGTPAFVFENEIVPGMMQRDVMLQKIDAARKAK